MYHDVAQWTMIRRKVLEDGVSRQLCGAYPHPRSRMVLQQAAYTWRPKAGLPRRSGETRWGKDRRCLLRRDGE